jgi:hypothetical protein
MARNGFIGLGIFFVLVALGLRPAIVRLSAPLGFLAATLIIPALAAALACFAKATSPIGKEKG